MSATVSVLMAAHIAEVMVWALAYAIVDAAPAGTDLVYFAFVNYATLGYGDITPLQRWHLIGPMTAMNGVLLFGWSTAVIFSILQKAWLTDRDRRGIAGGRLDAGRVPCPPYPFTSYCLLRWSPIWTSIMTLSG